MALHNSPCFLMDPARSAGPVLRAFVRSTDMGRSSFSTFMIPAPIGDFPTLTERWLCARCKPLTGEAASIPARRPGPRSVCDFPVGNFWPGSCLFPAFVGLHAFSTSGLHGTVIGGIGKPVPTVPALCIFRRQRTQPLNTERWQVSIQSYDLCR
jgi:hypothetical protein